MEEKTGTVTAVNETTPNLEDNSTIAEEADHDQKPLNGN